MTVMVHSPKGRWTVVIEVEADQPELVEARLRSVGLEPIRKKGRLWVNADAPRL